MWVASKKPNPFLNILPFKKDFPFLFTNNQVCLPICQQMLLVFSMKTILLNSSNQKNWKGTLVIKLQYSTWLFSMSSVCFHAQFRICLFSQKKEKKRGINIAFDFTKLELLVNAFLKSSQHGMLLKW